MKPILFSTAMVQAIIAGNKTQTRRIIKPQPNYIESSGRWIWPIPKKKIRTGCCESVCTASREWYEYLRPEQLAYQVGDILWVRETWRGIKQDFGNDRYEYKATEKINTNDKWKPSIFMPKEACRLFLKIKTIRVERLQDISQEDAKAEGIDCPCPHRPASTDCTKHKDNSLHRDCYVCAFKVLWQQINHNWNNNPFVWVIEFDPPPQVNKKQ